MVLIGVDPHKASHTAVVIDREPASAIRFGGPAIFAREARPDANEFDIFARDGHAGWPVSFVDRCRRSVEPPG